MAVLWTPEVLDGWRPPERLSGSEWAERYRVIISPDAAEPGKWTNARTPYLSEIMDVLCDSVYEEVVFMKAARVGGTEAVRNALCYWLDQEPGPILWVYPTEQASKEQVRKEIIPLLTEHPRLQRLLTGRPRDLKVGELALTSCNLYTGWAGSPQTLGMRTIRRFVGDEIDKFPEFSGRDADPVSLGRRRVTTFGRRGKSALISTPTQTTGRIYQAWMRCLDKRRYAVRCVRCDHLFVPEWQHVDFTGRDETISPLSSPALAERIEATNEAWLVCPACDEKHDERKRVRAVRGGLWLSDGFPPYHRPISRRVGFHCSALVSSLGVTIPRLAGQYLRAMIGDYGDRMEFWTQALGLPYDGDAQMDRKAGVGRLVTRDAVYRRGAVPTWASVLTLGIDTQADGWKWVARAWAPNGQSRLVDYGFAESEAQVLALVRKDWPVLSSMRSMGVSLALVDVAGAVELTETEDEKAGTSTDRSYMLATEERRLVPSMGRRRVDPPFMHLKEQHNRNGVITKILYHMTDFWKDRLVELVERSDSDMWQVTGDTGEEFVRAFSDAKKTENKDGSMTWGRRFKGADIDFFDCEALNLVAFRALRLRLQEARVSRDSDTAENASWLGHTEGWI